MTVELAPGPELKPAGARRFRILTFGGRRHAFKLEPSFWEALEEMARAKEQRLSALVGGLLANSVDGNATGLLRQAALDWTMGELKARQSRSVGQQWQRVIDLMSDPAFIINQGKQILLSNRAMRQFASGDSAGSGVQRLGLTVEVPRLLRLFEENEQRIVSLPCSLECAGRTMRSAIRVTMLERRRDQTLLLCALRPETALTEKQLAPA